MNPTRYCAERVAVAALEEAGHGVQIHQITEEAVETRMEEALFASLAEKIRLYNDLQAKGLLEVGVNDEAQIIASITHPDNLQEAIDDVMKEIKSLQAALNLV